jgi:hypothetical protein
VAWFWGKQQTEIDALKEQMMHVSGRLQVLEVVALSLMQRCTPTDRQMILDDARNYVVEMGDHTDPLWVDASSEQKQLVRDATSMWLQSFVETVKI